VIPLRPLGVGEILDGAITYIRSNPAATLGLSAVVITITQLIQLPIVTYLLDGLSAAAASPASTADLTGLVGTALAGSALGAFISFIATTILTGLLIVVLGEAVLGRRTPLGAAWAATRGRVPGLLGLSLLTTLALVAVLVVGILPTVLTALDGGSGGSVALAVLSMFVAIKVAIFLGVSWSMITPAYVLEGIPAMSAFRRSYRLVRPQWWRVFGILLLGTIITAIVGIMLNVPFGVVTALLDGTFDQVTGAVPTPGLAGTVVSVLGTIVASTITAPFAAGITGLLYFDQRMRREAYDLELMRVAQFPNAPLPGAPAAGSPYPGYPPAGPAHPGARDPQPPDPDPRYPHPPR
jgi:hypothetical protein